MKQVGLLSAHLNANMTANAHRRVDADTNSSRVTNAHPNTTTGADADANANLTATSRAEEVRSETTSNIPTRMEPQVQERDSQSSQAEDTVRNGEARRESMLDTLKKEKREREELIIAQKKTIDDAAAELNWLRREHARQLNDRDAVIASLRRDIQVLTADMMQ